MLIDSVFRKKLLACAGALNVIAAFIISTYQVHDPLAAKLHSFYPQVAVNDFKEWFTLSLFFSFLLVGLSVIVALAALAFHFFGDPDFSPLKNISAKKAVASDARDIFAMAREEFGERCSSLEQIARFMQYSLESTWIVRSKNQPVGYFVVFGLKVAGERAILDGYYNGANPPPEHIHRRLRQAKALCVGGIVGRGMKGKAATLGAMMAFVSSLQKDRVYARPVSKDGLRLATSNGMKGLDGRPAVEIDQYCVLQTSADSR